MDFINLVQVKTLLHGALFQSHFPTSPPTTHINFLRSTLSTLILKKQDLHIITLYLGTPPSINSLHLHLYLVRCSLQPLVLTSFLFFHFLIALSLSLSNPHTPRPFFLTHQQPRQYGTSKEVQRSQAAPVGLLGVRDSPPFTVMSSLNSIYSCNYNAAPFRRCHITISYIKLSYSSPSLFFTLPLFHIYMSWDVPSLICIIYI